MPSALRENSAFPHIFAALAELVDVCMDGGAKLVSVDVEASDQTKGGSALHPTRLLVEGNGTAPTRDKLKSLLLCEDHVEDDHGKCQPPASGAKPLSKIVRALMRIGNDALVITHSKAEGYMAVLISQAFLSRELDDKAFVIPLAHLSLVGEGRVQLGCVELLGGTAAGITNWKEIFVQHGPFGSWEGLTDSVRGMVNEGVKVIVYNRLEQSRVLNGPSNATGSGGHAAHAADGASVALQGLSLIGRDDVACEPCALRAGQYVLTGEARGFDECAYRSTMELTLEHSGLVWGTERGRLVRGRAVTGQVPTGFWCLPPASTLLTRPY